MARKFDLTREQGIHLVLGNAMSMLDRVRRAMVDLGDPDPWRAGTAVYLIAVLGRSVTQILQKIGHYDKDHWLAWWTPRQAFMSSDPMLIYLNKVRNDFLKEGGGYHADRFLFGVSGEWYLTNAPAQHNGHAIPVNPHLDPPLPSIQTLGELYINWLQSVVDETTAEFAPGSRFESRYPQTSAPPPVPETPDPTSRRSPPRDSRDILRGQAESGPPAPPQPDHG